MYRKREREFQYPPGIEKIIEDVIGGGTIDRRDLQNALFNGKALDELPPIVIVVKDPETGLYHVLKTALVSEAAAADATAYKVAKNHLFGVGDFVTIGGALTGASDKITAIDKSNAEFDTITLEATIGAAFRSLSTGNGIQDSFTVPLTNNPDCWLATVKSTLFIVMTNSPS